jgi:predicted phage-related endonuclease
MITNEQRERRSTGIFSSDVPRIMAGEGVRVALEKLGQIERENLDDVPEVQLGNLIEPRILDAFEAQHGRLEVRSPDTLRHPSYQWLGAHLDGWTATEVVEAKSVGWYKINEWGEPGSDEVPDRVLWQVQEQMAVCKLKVAKVPVCFLTEAALVAYATGNPLPIEVYVIPGDADLEAYIIERCGKVWQHVEAKTLPEPETALDARLLYKRDSGAVIEADETVFAAYQALVNVREELKGVEKAKDELSGKLQLFMREASEIRYQGKTLVTWKKEKDRAAYTVAAREGSRKFLVKEIK